MKGKMKAGYRLARISEVILWIAAAFMAAAFLTAVISPDMMRQIYDKSAGEAGKDVIVNSFSGGFGGVSVMSAENGLNVGMYLMYSAAGAVEAVLLALVFRRIWQIVKLSWGSTPFQKPVVAKVRQIGWLVIAVPLMTLAMSLVSFVVFWPEYSFTVNVTGIITGVIVLALSQIFSYGVKLEDDVEGLL